MAAHLFQSVPTILHGFGCLQRLPEVLPEDRRRVLIVTGCRAMREIGVLEQLTALLSDCDIDSDIFEGVPPEPEVTVVDQARERAQDFHADLILGVGGGSALDVAKSVAGLAKEPDPTAAYLAGQPLTGCGLPHILIPSTFGTGTEVTPNAVLINPETKTKKSIRHDDLRPCAAIVDPALGMSAPARVKAESGLDALTQAIEGYCSRFATPLTDGLALQGARLLLANLRTFVTQPEDQAAAEGCALGSTLAGMAFANSRLGLIHGIVHPLGVRTGAPHGRLCGLFLPHALHFNRSAAPEKIAHLDQLAGEDIAEHCAALLEALGVGRELEASLDSATRVAIAEETLPSGSLAANPREVTADDLLMLMEQVCPSSSLTSETPAP